MSGRVDAAGDAEWVLLSGRDAALRAAESVLGPEVVYLPRMTLLQRKSGRRRGHDRVVVTQYPGYGFLRHELLTEAMIDLLSERWRLSGPASSLREPVRVPAAQLRWAMVLESRSARDHSLLVFRQGDAVLIDLRSIGLERRPGTVIAARGPLVRVRVAGFVLPLTARAEDLSWEDDGLGAVAGRV